MITSTQIRLRWPLPLVLALTYVTSARAALPGTSGTTLMQQVLGYEPNIAVAGATGVLSVIIGLVHFHWIYRGRDWKWATCLPIGAIAYGLGFFVRIYFAKKAPDSQGAFIAMQILIACSPAAFLAFNYIVYGKIISDCVGGRHSLLRPKWVTIIFVLSDITTFFIQAGGASLMTKADTLTRGKNIFLTGLVIQNVSYFFFFGLVLLAHRSILRGKDVNGREPWWKALWALYASSIPIMIRCVFRCIEIGMGKDSVLSTKEVYFYVLDPLMLLIAISVYVLYWPGKYIKAGSMVDYHEDFKMNLRSPSGA